MGSVLGCLVCSLVVIAACPSPPHCGNLQTVPVRTQAWTAGCQLDPPPSQENPTPQRALRSSHQKPLTQTPLARAGRRRPVQHPFGAPVCNGRRWPAAWWRSAPRPYRETLWQRYVLRGPLCLPDTPVPHAPLSPLHLPQRSRRLQACACRFAWCMVRGAWCGVRGACSEY